MQPTKKPETYAGQLFTKANIVALLACAVILIGGSFLAKPNEGRGLLRGMFGVVATVWVLSPLTKEKRQARNAAK